MARRADSKCEVFLRVRIRLDENPYQRWHGETHLHPLAVLAILVLGTAMLSLPRRYAVIPMLVMGCFVSPAQQVAVASLNFDLLRIMVLFGSARVLLRGEWRGFTSTSLDWAVLAWGVVGTTMYILQHGTMAAVKYKMGVCYDAFGMYFLFRIIVRSWRDWDTVVKGAAIIAIPVAVAFTIEHVTARNMFAVFGGVRAITWVREGRLRCQGAFAHAIMAGCYFASLLPLIAALWWMRGSARRWGAAGAVSSLVVIVACASSTPITAVVASVFAAAAFRVRRLLPYARWAAVVLIVMLHLMMSKPVWHLLGRVDLAGGSTGYHRYRLIDAAVTNLGEWWLVGTPSTQHWGPQLHDITNQYLLEGVRGGLVTMMLFLALIAVAFRLVGRIVRAHPRDPARAIMAWALGAALCAHCASFLAVSYFGQIQVVWYLLLAAIGSLSLLPAPIGESQALVEMRKKAVPTMPGKTNGSRSTASHALQLSIMTCFTRL